MDRSLGAVFVCENSGLGESAAEVPFIRFFGTVRPMHSDFFQFIGSFYLDDSFSGSSLNIDTCISVRLFSNLLLRSGSSNRGCYLYGSRDFAEEVDAPAFWNRIELQIRVDTCQQILNGCKIDPVCFAKLTCRISGRDIVGIDRVDSIISFGRREEVSFSGGKRLEIYDIIERFYKCINFKGVWGSQGFTDCLNGFAGLQFMLDYEVFQPIAFNWGLNSCANRQERSIKRDINDLTGFYAVKLIITFPSV